MNKDPALQNIKNMYEKITYFDQYGGSVLLYIIITIILVIMVSYCFIMINAQPIIDDWPNQRCKPNIIPVAGFITRPEGVSAFDYTYQNFTYCTQNILSSITGTALEPLSFVTTLLSNMAKQIGDDIQSIRGVFDKIRTFSQDISEEIMGRIMNFTIPLQQIVIAFKDIISKIEGTLTAALFTSLGTYYTLKSFMGAIAQFIISILIGLAAMIAVFWVLPFTWGAAIASTSVFVAIAIPMAIILAFMVDVLHVKTNLKLPKVKCFDEDTLITMNDGKTMRRIADIRIDDVLMDGNVVTACIQVAREGSTMYQLYGIMVSDSHIVQYKNTWLRVSEHPDAIKCVDYNKPFLYCLNTSNKNIVINNCIFTDWDEIYLECDIKINKSDIHSFMDSGFCGNTKIKLKNGSYKELKNIVIGDILENGENVYGVVKIDGANVNKQFKYYLGENVVVEGGPHLVVESHVGDFIHKSILQTKYGELYHLLTDTQTFHVENTLFYDYNAAIDLFLDKSKEKLLSMKYV